jgi:uncharacterized protein GlcG (DUF336 family)
MTGKVVGGIGVSGLYAAEDERLAQLGAEAIKKVISK